MLTKAQGIAFVDGSCLRPDRLMRHRDSAYLDYARRMLRVYRCGAGKSMRDIHREVLAVFAGKGVLAARRARAFATLLDEDCKFGAASGDCAELRGRVFEMAAGCRPALLGRGGEDLRRQIARDLGLPWEQIARDLFADLPGRQRLLSFSGDEDPGRLLARYNVAQTRVAILDAVALRVRATADFKQILRFAKLARLLHSIVLRGPGEYEFALTGSGNAIGGARSDAASMGNFLPGLLSCRGWALEADIMRTGRLLRLALSEGDGLHGHSAGPLPFDSSKEAAFAREWGEGARGGWRLERESQIFHKGQTCYFPDFAFRNEADGRAVFLEIVGFWTRDYLRAKRRVLEELGQRNIILALSASTLASVLPQVKMTPGHKKEADSLTHN